MDLLQKITECASYIQANTSIKPKTGIILGTGLGGLVKHIDIETTIDYKDVPHFVDPTVMEHEGKLIFGKIEGQEVMVMQGRFHFYEGYTFEEITFPVRVMKAIGCENMFVSNACGGINPKFAAGDIMIIEDHINLLGTSPLVGKNIDSLGDRFPDMIEPYNKGLIALAKQACLEDKIPVQEGVYAIMSGPNLETRAEYRMLGVLGADVIGMSTVPEAIVAVHAGLKTLGISVITDECLPDALKPVNIDEIVATAIGAEPKLVGLIKGVLKRI